jgi:hypothetical protein
MHRNLIFLHETGFILNEKMMPDITIMVKAVEIVKNVLNTKMSKD